MGRRDRERYDREKAVYKGPWKVPDIKDPNGPKKPMSAFLAFGNERRKDIAAANPAMTGTEISSLLAKLWRECPTQVKQCYRDREAREREQFKRDRAEFDRQKDQALVEAIMSDNSVEETATSVTVPAGVGGEADFGSSSHVEDKKLPHFVIPKNIFTMTPPKMDDMNEHNLFKNLEAVTSVRHKSSDTEFGNATSLLTPATTKQYTLDDCPASAAAAGFSLDSRCVQQHHHQQEQQQDTQFDRLSWEDILENDELFEDFSPSNVPEVPSCGRATMTRQRANSVHSLCSYSSLSW